MINVQWILWDLVLPPSKFVLEQFENPLSPFMVDNLQNVRLDVF